MASVMKLVNKLYQQSVVERIDATSWATPTSFPFVVELDPTAACDLACPGCISEDIIAVGNRFTDERLLELAREFIECGVKAVILIGGGEPLAHRKAGELIETLGKADVHVGITTNGSFIDRYIEPIAEYSKWTRVSMDAATEHMFGILRPTKYSAGRNKFQRITDNMRLLAKRKKGKLGYSFLIQTPADGAGIESNVGEIYAAALLARDIGCDYFELKPSYQFREGVNHALMPHEADQMRRAEAEIARLEELETAAFKIVYAINLNHSLEGIKSEQPKEYKTCPSTLLRTTITPGGAYVCPYWRGKEQMKIGDVTETSFLNMWTSYERHQVQTRLDASQDCNFHCLRHESNQTMRSIKQRLSTGVTIATVDEFDRFI